MTGTTYPAPAPDSVAIFTMAYNESAKLPVWVRHYRAHCPRARLFVLDHGSDDGSTDGLDGVSVTRLVRSPFDERIRVSVVGAFQRQLLRDHEVVIFTDCDEMLLADPRRYGSLHDFLAATQDAVIAPAGMHVLHRIDREAPLDPGRPVLGQRRFVEFESGMCKPSVSRVPLNWDVGFHGADIRPAYRADLFQFHLGYMDRSLALARLAVTRSMAWSEAALQAGNGFHQRLSDEDYLRRSFLRPLWRIQTEGVADFDFAADLARLEASVSDADGFWLPRPHFWGRIAEVPAELCGRL